MRRRGAAGRLIDAALVWARGAGIKAVYLEVRKSNEAAISLYNKNGFRQVGTRKSYYESPNEDALVMAVELQRRPVGGDSGAENGGAVEA